MKKIILITTLSLLLFLFTLTPANAGIILPPTCNLCAPDIPDGVWDTYWCRFGLWLLFGG